MPNESLTDALQEAYALAPKSLVILDTLQITNVSLGAELFLVRDLVSQDLTLEDLSIKTFEPVGFRMELPTIGDNGLQELTIAIDNVDRRITDFINTVKASNVTTEIRYRPYLATDPTTPQMNPPLLLFLKEISISAVEIQGRATFADIVNKKFPNEWFTRTRFPSLGSQ